MNDKTEDFSCQSSGEKPNFYLEIKFPSVKGGYVLVWDCIYCLLELDSRIKKGKYCHGIASAIIEALFNAEARGNKGDPQKEVFVKLSFFDDFFVVGIKDDGCFYKNKNIKKLVENKQKLPDELAPPFCDSSGNGMDIIYEFTDKIFVDTNSGVLYLLFYYQTTLYSCKETKAR